MAACLPFIRIVERELGSAHERRAVPSAEGELGPAHLPTSSSPGEGKRTPKMAGRGDCARDACGHHFSRRRACLIRSHVMGSGGIARLSRQVQFGPVADASRPRAGGLTRDRLQGQGGHDGRRVMRPARVVFAPGNVVTHLQGRHCRVVHVSPPTGLAPPHGTHRERSRTHTTTGE